MRASSPGLEMHTGKMTLDQATDFFVKEGYQVRPVAEMEAQARHQRSDVSGVHAGQTADHETAGRL